MALQFWRVALLVISILAENCRSLTIELLCYKCKSTENSNCKIVDDSTSTFSHKLTTDKTSAAVYCVTQMNWDETGKVNGSRYSAEFDGVDPGYPDKCDNFGAIVIPKSRALDAKIIPKRRICYCKTEKCNKQPMYDEDTPPPTAPKNHSPHLIFMPPLALLRFFVSILSDLLTSM